MSAAGGVASPCINVCRMDEATALCLGCFRTLDEIARWSRADDDERRTILAAVDRRRGGHVPNGGGSGGDGEHQGKIVTEEDPYLCVGVCMADPDSGYCLGCGRPPLPSPFNAVVAEAAAAQHLERQATGRDPDTPNSLASPT